MIRRGKHCARIVITAWLAVPCIVLAMMAMAPGGLSGAPAPQAGTSTFALTKLSLNTVFVSLTAALVATALAFLPALIAARVERGRLRAAMLLLGSALILAPPPVIAVASVHMLGAQGYLTQAALTIFPLPQQTGSSPPILPAPIFSLPGTALALCWAYFPIPLLVLFVAFRRVPAAWEELALLEASPVRALWRASLNGKSKAILIALILTMLLCATDFSVPESLRSQPVLVREVYSQFGVFYDARQALKAALLLCALVVGLALAAWVMFRSASDAEVGNQEEALGSWTRWPRSAGLQVLRAVAWLLAIAPFALLIAALAASLRGPAGYLQTFAITWQVTREEFLFSLELSLAAAVLIALAGLVLGVSLAALKRPAFARSLLLFCFVLPGPVYGVALKSALLWPPNSLPFGIDGALANFDGSLGPVLLAWATRFAPLVALLVESELRTSGGLFAETCSLETNAAVGHVRTWAARLLAPPLITGFALAFCLTIAESGAAVLLLPPGPTTLSVRLMTLMHYAPTSQVSALCLLMIMPCFVALPVVFAYSTFRFGSLQTRSGQSSF
ncbi:hypothetical protein BH09SUM1_BH09SUM1_04970 [soil metagenome]